MGVVILKDMVFHAYHGCWDFEKKQGNTFIVSLEMEFDTSKAERSDNLYDTLNYQEVYDLVKREMGTPSNLIEHIARRICDAVKSAFPQINRVQISLSKKHPPLGGEVGSVCIVL